MGAGRERVDLERLEAWANHEDHSELTCQDSDRMLLKLAAELRELRRFEQRIRNVAARSPASRVGTVVDNYDADPSTQAEGGGGP